MFGACQVNYGAYGYRSLSDLRGVKIMEELDCLSKPLIFEVHVDDYEREKT